MQQHFQTISFSSQTTSFSSSSPAQGFSREVSPAENLELLSVLVFCPDMATANFAHFVNSDKLGQPRSTCQAPPKGHCKILQLLFWIFIATSKNSSEAWTAMSSTLFLEKESFSVTTSLAQSWHIFSLAEQVASLVFTFQRDFRGLTSMSQCWDTPHAPKCTDPADLFVNMSLDSVGCSNNHCMTQRTRGVPFPKPLARAAHGRPKWENNYRCSGMRGTVLTTPGKSSCVVLTWNEGTKFKMAVAPMWIDKFRME